MDVKSRQFPQNVFGGLATASMRFSFPPVPLWVLGDQKGELHWHSGREDYICQLAKTSSDIFPEMSSSTYSLQVPAAPGLSCWAITMGLGCGENKGARTCSTNSDPQHPKPSLLFFLVSWMNVPDHLKSVEAIKFHQGTSGTGGGMSLVTGLAS